MIIINSVLCYINSAIKKLPEEEVLSSAAAYFSADALQAAKEELFTELEIDQVNTRKGSGKELRTCQDLISKIKDSKKSLPTYVAETFDAMPPQGFHAASNSILAMKDTISMLNEKMEKMCESMELKASKDELNAVKSKLTAKTAPEIELEPPVTSMNKAINKKKPKNKRAVKPTATAVNNDSLGRSYAAVASLPAKPTVTSPHVRQQQKIPKAISKHTRVSAPKMQLGTGNNSSLLEPAHSAPRTYDILVGNCNKFTTAENLAAYIRVKSDVNIVGCKEHPTRVEHAKFFKITTRTEDREKLLNPEVWPRDISVRKFFRKKSFTGASASIIIGSP